MNYLVTGAAGFIGAAIVERLLQSGNECVTIDNLFTGREDHIPKGCRFIKGDVGNSDVIAELKDEKFDAIIHIAGQSSGEISFDNPIYDLQTNTQSTLLLLKLAREIGCKKFIYASSMSTYGDHIPPICDEETITVPRSFYAVGKLASEHYMRIFSEYGITCTALRFFNVYGPGQNMRNLRQGMASIFLAMAIKERHIHVKGSKDRFRDFVYIDDVVNAVLSALKREEGFDIYNVCTGVPTTVETVVRTIRDALPYDVTVDYSNSTPGDQFGIYGNNKKIKADLGWEPVYDFKKGMGLMIDWAISEAEF